MPSGAPREASHGGKRCSNGRIKALPSGDKPATAMSAMLVTTSQLAEAGEARAQQDKTGDADRNQNIGRQREEAEYLGQDEEHAQSSSPTRCYASLQSAPNN